MSKVEVPEIKKCRVTFTIKGTSPLITHRWGQKAIDMMRDKHAGKKTKTREVRDPEAEAIEAAYTTKDGQFGIPGMGFKSALITAAHKDIGIEKTLVRKALFLETTDPEKVLPMDEGEKPVIREDPVRVGAGSADLRYRPMWEHWSVMVRLQVDAQLLSDNDIANLVNRAGFGVGICEWRPEKDGEYGRFEIDRTKPFICEPVEPV